MTSCGQLVVTTVWLHYAVCSCESNALPSAGCHNQRPESKTSSGLDLN